jgi:LmbE family N-acetylglucosaminyl deacetylase
MTGPVLALMAHPDDAELLCAGTLARFAQAGHAIHILTMTAGDCGSLDEDARSIANRRMREARDALAHLDGTYHCLGESDGRVVFDKPTIQKTVECVRSINPALMFTHAPKDYMMDHEVTSQLARSASFFFPAPNFSAQPVPQNASIPYLYYCDPIEGIDPYGHVVEPTTYVPIGAQMSIKTAMLAEHASQREWLRAHHGMDEYIEAMERHAAWRGQQAGTDYAEAFVQHRGHGYPREDILTQLPAEHLAAGRNRSE